MTDKELIKKWLKVKLAELYEESQCEVPEISQEIIKGKMISIKESLSFIDSLQEEPVSNPIDFEKELYKAFGQVKDFTLGMQIAKRFYEMGRKYHEPVSEDLEEAASRYAKEEYNHKSPATLHDRCKGCYAPLMYAFKAGANWQKEKDMQKFLHSETATFTREEFDTEMEEVRKQTKKQMINKATKWLEENLAEETPVIVCGSVSISFEHAIEEFKKAMED